MRLYKNFISFAFALTLFCACADDIEYSKGSYAEETFGLQFPESKSIEIAPDDNAVVTYEVRRRDTEGEVQLPVVVTENTDSVFEISPIIFADGDSIALMRIDFSKAETGKNYTLKLEVNDPRYVNNYSIGNHFSLDAIKVKWNPIGLCTYTDDILSVILVGGATATYQVQVYERDDKKGLFRIEDCYRSFAQYEDGSVDPTMWDDSQPWYIEIDAQDPLHVTIPNAFTGLSIPGFGGFYVWGMADYYLEQGDSAQAENYYGKYEYGEITFPVGGIMAGFEALGGYLTSNGSGAFKLVIDPTQKKYEADPKYDFDWEEVNDAAQFSSSNIGYSGIAPLYKGICSITTDGCDTVFANTYGDCYKLSNAYGQGTDLYFTVKDGTVGVPGLNYRLQDTGISTLGQKVYAKINTGGSTFSDKLIELSITYLNEDGSIEFGTDTATISNVKYIEWGTGIFTCNNYLVQGPEVVTIYKEEGEDIYRINDWIVDGMDMYFRWDRTTDNLYIDPQVVALGYYDDGTPFLLAVMDVVSSGFADDFVSEGLIDDPRSYYDSETMTFNFTTVYGDYYTGDWMYDDMGNPVIGNKETLEIVSSIEMEGKVRNSALNVAPRTALKSAKRSSSRFKSKNKFSRFNLTPKKRNKYSLFDENVIYKRSFR